MTGADVIASVVALNGGKLVGKTRLQKVVFLLDHCGLKSGFEFDYHNFGPFSAELAEAADFARAEGRVRVRERPGFHEVPYSEFTTSEKAPKRVGGLDSKTVQLHLQKMEQFSAVELELAATIAYLKDFGVTTKQVDQVVEKLKPLKATAERLKKAHTLLKEIGANV